jgi:uncharacterized protein DUF6941
MAITARYILMADDIRREDSGKIIIMGMYTPDMTVMQIPFVMPTLAFFLNLESDRPGNFRFSTRITHQDTGNVVPQTDGMGMLAVTNPQQAGIAAVKFVGVTFNAPGLYSFSLEIDGQREPIVSTFNVQLVIPQTNQAAAPGGFRR